MAPPTGAAAMDRPITEERADVDPAEQASAPQAEPSPAAPDADPAGPAPADECRICLFGDHPENMVQPCHCLGSVRYAHLKCLKSWIHERADLRCEICRSPYNEALLPELQPVLEAALLDRARGARARLPPLIVTRPPPPASDEDDDDETPWRSRKFWIKLTMAVLVLALIVSLLVFLGVNAGDSTWAAVLLRIIAFGLPTFIVIRAVISCWGVSRSVEEERRAAWAAEHRV